MEIIGLIVSTVKGYLTLAIWNGNTMTHGKAIIKYAVLIEFESADENTWKKT